MRRRRITAATLKEAQGWLGLRPEVSRHRARSGIRRCTLILAP